MLHSVSFKCLVSRSSLFVIALTLLSCVVAAGCRQSTATNSEGPSAQGDRLYVVCTTTQVADIVDRVGGEHVEVAAIMGPGVDPHLYKATPADIDKFNRADVIFYNGLHLEGRLTDRLEELHAERPTVAVTDVLTKNFADQLLSPEEFEGHYDPHVWFDPTLWTNSIDAVRDQLAQSDSDKRDAYVSNAKAYADELLASHTRWKEQLATIDASRRVLVTAHDAFGYFGKAYDIEVRGLQGISTADETDLSTVNDLVDLLVSRKIKAVFVESSVSKRSIQSLIEGCQARGHKVVIGGELFSDAMGAAGTPEGTYIGMMDHNVKTIVESLK